MQTKIADTISRIEPATVNHEVVLALFEEMKALDPRDFTDVALFSQDRPYGRRKLYCSPNVEVLLMGFLPGRECPPHDHGEADGLVLVCHGEAEHKIYRLGDAGLSVFRQTREPAGSVLRAPLECVHSMGNGSQSELLITLHVYWPPIRKMSVFDVDARRVYVVNEAAGAWLPVDPTTLIDTYELS